MTDAEIEDMAGVIADTIADAMRRESLVAPDQERPEAPGNAGGSKPE
jgi:hypothetical protein